MEWTISSSSLLCCIFQNEDAGRYYAIIVGAQALVSERFEE
jgi:hypothetical protein